MTINGKTPVYIQARLANERDSIAYSLRRVLNMYACIVSLILSNETWPSSVYVRRRGFVIIRIHKKKIIGKTDNCRRHRHSMSLWKVLSVWLLLGHCSMAVLHADNPLTEVVRKKFYLERLDQCFCEVNHEGLTVLFCIHGCSIMSTNSKEFSLYSTSSCAGVNFNRFRRRAPVIQSTYWCLSINYTSFSSVVLVTKRWCVCRNASCGVAIFQVGLGILSQCCNNVPLQLLY